MITMIMIKITITNNYWQVHDQRRGMWSGILYPLWGASCPFSCSMLYLYLLSYISVFVFVYICICTRIYLYLHLYWPVFAFVCICICMRIEFRHDVDLSSRFQQVWDESPSEVFANFPFLTGPFCFIVQVKLSLVCVPQKFPIKERPVETNLLTFIWGLWSIHKSGFLDKKLGLGSLEARHTASCPRIPTCECFKALK